MLSPRQIRFPSATQGSPPPLPGPREAIAAHRLHHMDQLGNSLARAVTFLIVQTLLAALMITATRVSTYLLAWIGWWARMLTTHLFYCVFVVQGPLVVHDYHHRSTAYRLTSRHICAVTADGQ
jgi:hypothetical protein